MQQFNIGDWITIGDGSPHQFKRFTKDLPEWNKALNYENVEMLCGARFHILNFDRSIVKRWQPKEGEWCWFYSSNIEKWYITKWENSESQIASLWHKNCKPFIGEIPN